MMKKEQTDSKPCTCYSSKDGKEHIYDIDNAYCLYCRRNKLKKVYNIEIALDNFAKIVKEKGFGHYKFEVIFTPVSQYEGAKWKGENRMKLEEARRNTKPLVQYFDLYKILPTGEREYISYCFDSSGFYRMLKKLHPDRRNEIDMLEKKIRFNKYDAPMQYLL